MRPAWLLPVALLVMASPARAQESEDEICPDRPGIASSTCIVSPGRVQVELAIDWTFEEDGDVRTDTVLAGDAVVRVGVGPETEVQAGLTTFGHVRERDGPAISRSSGVGDAFIGVRQRVMRRGALEAAVQARVSLPVGGNAAGAGDWGAELLLPLGLTFGEIELLLTPAVAAVPDLDRDGRHLGYGLAAGLNFPLVKRLTAVLDFALSRDDDPLEATSEAVGGVSFAYSVNRDLELDAGLIFGLNRTSPDLELYLGASGRF